MLKDNVTLNKWVNNLISEAFQCDEAKGEHVAADAVRILTDQSMSEVPRISRNWPSDAACFRWLTDRMWGTTGGLIEEI